MPPRLFISSAIALYIARWSAAESPLSASFVAPTSGKYGAPTKTSVAVMPGAVAVVAVPLPPADEPGAVDPEPVPEPEPLPVPEPLPEPKPDEPPVVVEPVVGTATPSGPTAGAPSPGSAVEPGATGAPSCSPAAPSGAASEEACSVEPQPASRTTRAAAAAPRDLRRTGVIGGLLKVDETSH